MDRFASEDGAAVFRAVNRVMEGGHDPRRFAADLLDRFRDLIVLAAVPGAGQTGLLDLPADRLDRMTEQACRFGQAELTRAAEIISEGLIQMRGTTSPRLTLELVCAQILLPAASSGEKALLARLERLERRLESAELGDTPAAPQHAGPADTQHPQPAAPPAAAARPTAPPPAAPVEEPAARARPQNQRPRGPPRNERPRAPPGTGGPALRPGRRVHGRSARSPAAATGPGRAKPPTPRTPPGPRN